MKSVGLVILALAATPFAEAILPIFNKLTPAKYEASIKIDNLLGHSKKLWEFAHLPGASGTRSFGGVGYNASADYLERLARKHGYKVERQTVLYPATTILSNTLKIGADDIAQAEITTFQFSQSVSLTAPVVLVPGLGCDPLNYTTIDATNKIALISRGNCTFGEKGLIAKAQNAGAIIIYNNVAGGPVGSRLEPDYEANPAALSISQNAALPYVQRLQNGENLEATLVINVVNEQRASDNVIATTKQGNQNKILLVGSHLDSVPAGAGINDDGSGTAANAELLIQLSKFTGLKNTVRFAWWTTEELGLVGSQHYVDTLSAKEKSKIYANINMDMIASTNYIIGVYDGDNSGGANTGNPTPPGSGALEKLFQDHFVQRGVNWTAYAFGSGSDYRPFLDAGIPSGGVSSGAGGLKTQKELELFGGQLGVAYDPCYHQLCDNLQNLDNRPYLWIARAVADVVARLTLSDPKVILADPPKAGSNAKAAPEHVADLGDECHSHYEEL